MSVIVKRCSCGREYTPIEWEALQLIGWMGDDTGNALELRVCLAPCESSIAVPVTRAELEAIVDGIGGQITYRPTHDSASKLVAGECDGWDAFVGGAISLPPHMGRGPTAAGALAEVMTFALRIGALK